jgi:hypothetical protein
LDFQSWKEEETDLGNETIRLLADIALILTFLALLWYSFETRGMKNQLVRQNELSLRPCILISYEIDQGSYCFINVGNGPALHVQLKEIPFLESEDNCFTYKTDACDLIVPKGRSRVVFREDNGSIASAFHLGAIDPKSAINTFDITATYSSIDDIKYATYGKMGKIGSKFIKTIKL